MYHTVVALRNQRFKDLVKNYWANLENVLGRF